MAAGAAIEWAPIGEEVPRALIFCGGRIAPERTRPLAAGDPATTPAGMHHWSIAKGRTVPSVTFLGPYTITYLRAQDAPGHGSCRSGTEARTFPDTA